jgi:hypothetical protein
MSHIPYYGEDEDTKVFTNLFGPWTNYWGYQLEMATIDDMYMLKAVTPQNKKIITYHWNEESLERKIDLYNQDRRF